MNLQEIKDEMKLCFLDVPDGRIERAAKTAESFVLRNVKDEVGDDDKVILTEELCYILLSSGENDFESFRAGDITVKRDTKNKSLKENLDMYFRLNGDYFLDGGFCFACTE